VAAQFAPARAAGWSAWQGRCILSERKGNDDHRSPQRLPLSEAVGEIALALAVLPALATDDQSNLAQSSIAELIKLVDACALAMKERGEAFAAIGSLADVITIRGRSYASAHHAAVGQAHSFLGQLWVRLDTTNWEECQRQFLADPTSQAVQKWLNQTGLDPQLVTAQWERAKVDILELLPPEWRQEFKPVGARIVRERATLKSERPADDEHGEPDLFSFDEIRELLGVTPKRLQNVVSDWRNEGHAVNWPKSYAVLRPLLLRTWPNRANLFPESAADARHMLGRGN
jgi:hypothetical protein